MTTPTLDAAAYRRGWNDSAKGAPARVPDEYETATEIDGVDMGMDGLRVIDGAKG